MNPDKNNVVGINRTTTTVIIGLITLALGLVIGTAAEGGGKLLGASKTPVKPANQTSAAASSSATAGGMAQWNPFQEIRTMQQQMDQSFNRMFEQFRMDPQFNAFKENPGYSLSLDVRNLHDRYEVRAYLPDAKASDVHVSLTNGQTLKVEVSSQQMHTSGQKNLTTGIAEWGQYEQEIQFPTPVKADQMQIKRDGHELIITVPKAA